MIYTKKKALPFPITFFCEGSFSLAVYIKKKKINAEQSHSVKKSRPSTENGMETNDPIHFIQNSYFQ